MTRIIMSIAIAGSLLGCQNSPQKTESDDFKYFSEKFADIKIIRFQVPEFDELPLEQKKLIFFLSQAALEGRDIMYDQNNKNNLAVRRTLEAIYITYNGDRSTEDFKNFEIYLKRVWVSNGIHHHYSTDKHEADFSEVYFKSVLSEMPSEILPLKDGENKELFIDRISAVIFNDSIDAKRVNQAEGEDLIATSANNYYGEGITQEEVEAFYDTMKNPADKTPVSYGLNSKLVKENGALKENVWYTDGMYGEAITKIVYWLEKATTVTENTKQKEVIEDLIKFYKTGDLKTFDEYNIAWLEDHQSRIDFINGFIETYGDPLGLKASWESVVNFKDIEATHRTEIISSNAQWFEDNSPVAPEFKKKEVKGVTAKVITAAMLGGDCSPTTPIGINLPNADWIRKEHGSKSVTIENITHAYFKASEGDGFLQEFAYDQQEIERHEKYGFLTSNLHTDLHECLGHGSGQLLPNVAGDELKAYGATIEEARADLFGLYYQMDPKLVELGLLPTLEAAKAEYDSYIRNGLMTQLTRIKLGNIIEESHMRNRQLIAKWAYEKGKFENVIEKKVKDKKSYFVINDYNKLRDLFGQLLAEIQRIKSTGNFNDAKQLVEDFAVKVDPAIHKEVLDRYAKLNLAPYGAFINPAYELIEENGEITDIKVTYPDDFATQMMGYSKNHSWLPTYN